MQEVLALTLQSMQQDSVRLERVGANLANALTPGYKREVVSTMPFAQVFDALSVNSGGIPGSSGTMSIQSDMRPGTLKSTGQAFDLALAGDGFFEISTSQGPAYTRQGNFHVDARGRLVTAQGDPVMGISGEIVLTNQNVTIDGAGNIFNKDRASNGASSTAFAQLKIVRFENPGDLQRLGNGLLAGQGKASQMASGDAQVRQGFLENSNVSSMQEMVQLMQTMRHFESMQRIALGYDEMMSSAIRRLGDLS